MTEKDAPIPVLPVWPPIVTVGRPVIVVVAVPPLTVPGAVPAKVPETVPVTLLAAMAIFGVPVPYNELTPLVVSLAKVVAELGVAVVGVAVACIVRFEDDEVN